MEMRERATGLSSAEVELASSQSLLVVDAIDFRKPDALAQFGSDAVHRELLKLCAGFRLAAGVHETSATGNWCCDAFGGDKQLKLALQLIAAGEGGVSHLRLYPNAFEGDSTEEAELVGWEELTRLHTVGELCTSCS